MPHRFEVPQRCVNRVVLRRAAAIRKIIRQHSAIDVSRKCLQYLARNFRPPERQRKPGKRNHRVPAPIGKPRIARNHGEAFRVIRQRPVGNELIGGQNKLPQPTGLVVRRRRDRFRMLLLPCLEQFQIVVGLQSARLLAIQQGPGLRRKHQRQFFAGSKPATKDRRYQAILVIIQSAFALRG